MPSRAADYFLCAATLGRSFTDKVSIFWKLTKNLRVRMKLDRHRPSKIYSLETSYGPLHFRDNFGDITNLVSIFHHQVYRVGRLEEEGAVLDIGANIGLAAAMIAFHNPGRSIYCFEPLPGAAALIRRNCPRAEVEQVALGASRRPVRLRVDRDELMASSIPTRWETEEVEFETISLDEYAQVRQIEAVALMKIDVEGMESEILTGATRTLGRTRRVVMETHGRTLHEESVLRLRQAGFGIDDATFGENTGMVYASR